MVPEPLIVPARIITIPPPAAPLLIVPEELFRVPAPPPPPMITRLAAALVNAAPPWPPRSRFVTPGLTAQAAGAAVAAATTAGIFLILRNIGINTTATSITGSASRKAAVRIAFNAGVYDGRSRTVIDIARGSGNALALARMKVVAGKIDVIRRSAATTTRQLSRAATAKTKAIQTYGRTAERQTSRDVDYQNSASCSVPRQTRETRSKSRAGILRHADHLKATLARRAERGVCVAVYQAIARARAANRNRSSGGAGSNDVFVETRIVDGRCATRGTATNTIAICISVGRVDRRILHLNDQQANRRWQSVSLSQWVCRSKLKSIRRTHSPCPDNKC